MTVQRSSKHGRGARSGYSTKWRTRLQSIHVAEVSWREAADISYIASSGYIGGTRYRLLVCIHAASCRRVWLLELCVQVSVFSVQTGKPLILCSQTLFLPCDAIRCTVLVIVILSVRLSVTLVHCVHMVRHTIMISSPYGSRIILVSGDITIIAKFEGGHPERGRWTRVGWVRIGDFRPISLRNGARYDEGSY